MRRWIAFLLNTLYLLKALSRSMLMRSSSGVGVAGHIGPSAGWLSPREKPILAFKKGPQFCCNVQVSGLQRVADLLKRLDVFI